MSQADGTGSRAQVTSSTHPLAVRARAHGWPWSPPYTAPAVVASDAIRLGDLRAFGATDEGPIARAVHALVERAAAGCSGDWAALVPMAYSDYCQAVKDITRLQGAVHREQFSEKQVFIPGDSVMLRRFVKSLYQRPRHTPDFSGYVNYVALVNTDLETAINGILSQASNYVRESDRHEHTLIMGRTGGGKSELLKLLVHHYVKHPELGAVLVLDPHNTLGTQIARWREFAGKGAERLVYLDAMARPDMGGLTPALNPIVRGSATSDELASVAAQLADALAYLAGEDEGLTHYMKRVAMYGLRVLLDRDGSTLQDLNRGLSEDKGGLLAALGKDHSNEQVRHHFQHEFFGASKALGRLMIAQIAALGQRRRQNPFMSKAPLHVFVDEASLLMAPPVFTILQQMRKQNIWLTMAQHDFTDRAAQGLRGLLKINTKLKFVGSSDSVGDMFKLMDWKGDVPRLGRGQFVVSVTGGERHLLQAAEHLRDDTNAMSETEWAAVLEKQFTAYYRRVADAAPMAPAESKTRPAPAPAKPTFKRSVRP